MKIRSRMFVYILGLLAMSLWSTNAFSQATVTVSSTPETTAISTGHTEFAGLIALQAAAPAAPGIGAGSSVLTVDYRVPITAPATTVPGGTVTANYIVICGTGSLASTAPVALTGCANAYSYGAIGATGTYQIGGPNLNQLLISLPATAAAGTGTLTISGVKVSLNGYVPTGLTASLGVSTPPAGTGTYSITAGQNLTDVISSIQPAFTTIILPSTPPLTGAAGAVSTGTGELLSTTTVSDRLFNIDVRETFVDAFQATLGQNGYLNDALLTYTFNNIPNGVFLNFLGGTTGTSNASCSAATGVSPTDSPAFYNTNTFGATQIPNTSLSIPIVSNAANATTINFAGLPFNLTQPEAIRLRGCIYTSGAVALLATGTPITVSVTLSPNGSALAAGQPIPPVIGNFPRYQTTLVSANVITIVAPETDMLISFAVRNTSGFDTGIAIANTSTDPFGANGIAPNDGVITLNFYPQGSGAAFMYTTGAGSPGLGLSSTGNLVSGKTWSVGLSELLAAIPGSPTSFTGYIFVRTAFTNAHGAAYVTDYRGFTSASPFVIVPLGRNTTNENLNQ